MKRFIAWSLCVMCALAVASFAWSADFGKTQGSASADIAKVKSKVELVGTNPKGDEVLWEDGTAWKNVTVGGLDMLTKDGKAYPTIKIADVPTGKPVGAYTNTHLLRRDGQVVGLIRKTKSETGTPENYFTGFKKIIFSRDAK